jgi:ATP-dependent Zn protease
MTDDNDIDTHDDIDGQDDDIGAFDAGGRARRADAADTLAWHCLSRSLTPAQRRRLRRPGSLALIIEAPGPDWAEPLRKALSAFSPWTLLVARSGAGRADKRDNSADAIAQALARGGRVAGVAPDPARLLPATLVAAVDLTVKVRVSDAAIAETVLRATGRRPHGLPAGLGDTLGFLDIAAAIRTGDSAAHAVARLQAAARSRAIVDVDLGDAPDFATLSGFGEARVWGDELLQDLRDWRAGRIASFASIASRAVLASSPGLGKTTFVRSLARAADLPLIATSVSSWFGASPGYLDSIVKEIDAVFLAARSRPSLIFIDEIDAIPNRATLDSRHREWWTTMVDHLLLRLDSTISGAAAQAVIIGATNHPERLDAALVRPGRLDRILRIGMPDEAARAGILRSLLGPDLAGTNLLPAARLALGTTGADLAGYIKQARRAARIAGRPLAVSDLVTAIAPRDTRTPAERRRIAVHEAGHAVARAALGMSVDSVSIVSRGGTGGMTVSLGGLSAAPTREQMEAHVVASLAGRAAEEALLGDASLGAGGGADSDLARATGLTAALHASFGAGAGVLWRGEPSEAVRLLGDPGLRARVEADLDRLLARARELVRARAAAIETVARRLTARRHLTGAEVAALIRGRPS